MTTVTLRRSLPVLPKYIPNVNSSFGLNATPVCWRSEPVAPVAGWRNSKTPLFSCHSPARFHTPQGSSPALKLPLSMMCPGCWVEKAIGSGKAWEAVAVGSCFTEIVGFEGSDPSSSVAPARPYKASGWRRGGSVARPLICPKSPNSEYPRLNRPFM